MLEAAQYAESSFVTLTYASDKLPDGGSLVPKDLQDWLKRIRKKVAPMRLRFYAVGEYGDGSERPHYHAILFGFASCWRGQSEYTREGLRCCSRCELVRDTWGRGNIYLGSVGLESAQYVCGYVTKKMTMKDDARLQGRYPEFCRMSLRPGIGAGAMDELASQLMRYDLCKDGDVPVSLRHGKRLLPLGRYLRVKLRRLIGRDESAPESEVRKYEAEMLPLLLRARASEEDPSLRSQLVKSTAQAVRNMEARQRIFKSEKTL